MHSQTEYLTDGLNWLMRTSGGFLVLAMTVSLSTGSLAEAAEFRDDDVDWDYVEPSTDFDFRVERFEANPLIHREMHGMVEGNNNINGPSLIKVPDWVEDPLEEILGMFYFRVFERDGWHYALAKYINDGGVIYRSRDPLSGFEEGPRILPRVRHMALWENEDMLYVFFSRGEDKPEHIMVSRVENLDDDWEDWRFTEPQTVLKPGKDYEGVDEPIERSRFGATYDFVHQLRDPAIYEEDGRLYMLYSTAGEWAIAGAELHVELGSRCERLYQNKDEPHE